MDTSLNWGILAAGGIAQVFAKALKTSRCGKAVAAASRSQANADRFCHEMQIPCAYGSYQALLDDKDVQAIYISTPHPMHAEWAIKAAQAKKHVLCEKPVAMNVGETQLIIDAARANNVAFMEAFMYRCHPQTAKLIELLQAKTIGDVRMLQGAYGFPSHFDPQGRIYNKALGGGGILDVGCYPVSYIRLIAGVANGTPFADPVDVQAMGVLSETDVDDWTAAVMRFPGNIIAQVATSIGVGQHNGLRILGSGGSIHMPEAFHPAYWGGESTMNVHVHRKGTQQIVTQSPLSLFTIAIDTFTDHVLKGEQQVAWPGMRWDDSLGNMRTLDRWRECIGLRYDADKV